MDTIIITYVDTILKAHKISCHDIWNNRYEEHLCELLAKKHKDYPNILRAFVSIGDSIRRRSSVLTYYIINHDQTYVAIDNFTQTCRDYIKILDVITELVCYIEQPQYIFRVNIATEMIVEYNLLREITIFYDIYMNNCKQFKINPSKSLVLVNPKNKILSSLLSRYINTTILYIGSPFIILRELTKAVKSNNINLYNILGEITKRAYDFNYYEHNNKLRNILETILLTLDGTMLLDINDIENE